MFTDYITLALKNLTHRSLRSWLTLLGIFIGVAAVVSLIGLGDGLKEAVNSQFGISATEVITVQAGGISGLGPPGTAVSNPLREKDAEDIERLSSVSLAVPRNIENLRVTYNDVTQLEFFGSMPDGEKRDFVEEALDTDVLEGRMLKDGDNRRVVLGYNFYGDKAGFDKPIRAGTRIEIEGDSFEVTGILEKQGSFIFDNVILINEDVLKEYIDDKDRVDVIAVKVKSKDLMDRAEEDISKVLRKNRNVKEGEEDFEVQTPDAALSTVNGILSGVQVFIVMIASISILVGALGIVNTMTTAVLERKSQIGIMKAIGARNSDIFFQFLFESGLMGLTGGILGVIVGETIAYFGTVGINNFIGAEITPTIDFTMILLTLAGAFLIGCIAGIVPAMRAARENPVDALRG